MTDPRSILRHAFAALALALVGAHASAQTGDYIAAVVNQELVTAGELQQCLARIRDDANRSRTQLPP